MCNLLSTKGLGVKHLLVALFLIVTFAASNSHADIKPAIKDALNNGDTTRAIQLLEEQIEVDPGYHENYYMLGRIHYERGEWRKAREQFEKALEEKDKHWESLLYFGYTNLKIGDIEKAEQAMKRGRENVDDDDERELRAKFEDGYGLVMLEKENYQEADRAFRQALVYDSANAQYHIHLGDANYMQKIYPLAISEYEKALEVDTGSLEVYYHWAEACLEMRDYSCALDKLKIVLTKDSTHADAWNRAGSIYFKAAMSTRSRDERLSRFKETIGSYKRYFELADVKPDSDHVRPYFEMAMSYVNVYGFEDAVDYFEKVLSIPYEARDLYFYYGKSLWGSRQYKKAGDMIEKHMEWVEEQGEDYNSTVNEGEMHMLLGDSYYYRKPKQFTKALDHYKIALEVNPDHKRMLQNVAVGYHSLKDYVPALEYYQRRIAQGIDEKSAGLLKNAMYCAFNIATGDAGAAGGGEDDGLGDLEADMGMEMQVQTAAAADPNVDYDRLVDSLLTAYLSYNPDDAGKVLEVVGSTYLYQMSDCSKGVKYYTKMLEVDPDNCEALKSLGYAYFGGVCTINYPKALRYLNQAYNCKANKDGACADVDLVLWIAQANHLNAVDKANANEAAGDDFKAAYDWYGKVLKCEPSNEEAKKGQADTRFEF